MGRTALAGDLGPLLGAYEPGNGEDRGWSVFVGRDFETGGSVAELEGRAFVRGNFIAGKTGYVIGRAGGGSGVFPPAGVPPLVVGGHLLGNGSINTPGFPPIQIGSNIASTVTIIDRGPVIAGGVDYASADTQFANLRAASAWWGTLPSTPGGTIVSQWGGVYISADGVNGNPQTWVFNLDRDVTAPMWGFVFSGFEEGDSILVNCRKAGANSTFVLGVNSYSINGMTEKSPFADKLLWNFPEAKTVTLSGHAAFQGSVLVGSPDSVTTVAVPGHNGRFVTSGKLVHHGHLGCEFHNYPFTGSLPAPAIHHISGRVILDADRSQTITAPDTSLYGAPVALFTDPDGDGDHSDGVLVQSTQSAADGAYAFPPMVAGNYVVVLLSHAGDVKETLSVDLTNGSSTDNTFLTELDPAGYLYDTADGRIISGGSISVSGPGGVTILQDGTDGHYSFIVDGPGSYTVAVTPPAGYIIDPQRAPAGASYAPAGAPSPVVLGTSESKTQPGYLESPTATANPFYYTFDLAVGDPIILNNNYPLVAQDANPLAAAIDIRALVTAGGVAVEFSTIEEAGYNDIVLYVWLNGAWVEAGRAAAHGEGNHRYQFLIAGLDPNGRYDFKIEDDEGYTHYISNLAVQSFAASLVRMERDGVRYAFDSLPDRTYDVYRAASPAGPWGNPIKTVTAEDYVTTVMLPKLAGASSAFFKTVLRRE